MIAALVDIARDSKVPLVPSVMVAGEGSENCGMGGIPGLLLAMVAKDFRPLDGDSKPRADSPR